MIATGRVAALRRRLAEEKVAAVVISAPSNVAYLTGFEGVFDGEDAHAVVVSADALSIYSDGRYADALRAAAAGTLWDVRIVTDHLYRQVCEDLAGAEGPVGIEDTNPHRRFDYVRTTCDREVVALDGWIELLRQVKEPTEIERIDAAQQLTDAAFERLLSTIRVGMTEREIALRLEFDMRERGSEGVAFPPIVASGPNSARPHATVSDRELSAGDFVVLDFGARVDGYCADMTRTLVVGSADAQQRALYDAVLAANLAGIDALAAGRLGKDVYDVARAVLAERGYGELFTHGLGHGVGRDVHELPGMGPRGDKELPPNSVVTVEPGAYEPGWGGVRIEDLVVVEEGGCRVLTRSPKDLIEI